MTLEQTIALSGLLITIAGAGGAGWYRLYSMLRDLRGDFDQSLADEKGDRQKDVANVHAAANTAVAAESRARERDIAIVHAVANTANTGIVELRTYVAENYVLKSDLDRMIETMQTGFGRVEDKIDRVGARIDSLTDRQ